MGPDGISGMPEVFTDARADGCRLESEDKIFFSRLKISVLIKDPVIGKKGFRVSLDSFSIVEESGRVKDVSVLVDKTNEGSDRTSSPGNPVDGL